jgi:hypothetical protein
MSKNHYTQKMLMYDHNDDYFVYLIESAREAKKMENVSYVHLKRYANKSDS